MTTDLDSVIQRLCDMEKAVVAGSDAVPGAAYAQEGLGYWLNDVTGGTVELESEELQIVTYAITARYVGAEATEGYTMQPEQSVQTLIPTILQYFGQRRQLKRTSTDTPVVNLDPRGAVIVGFRVDRNLVSGIGQKLFGLDFLFEVPMIQDTNQLIF